MPANLTPQASELFHASGLMADQPKEDSRCTAVKTLNVFWIPPASSAQVKRADHHSLPLAVDRG
jgi:hypothetical protein